MSRRLEGVAVSWPAAVLVRRVLWALVIASVVLGAARVALAARAAASGRHALDLAVAALDQHHVDRAQAELRRARAGFTEAQQHLHNLGPLGWVADATPLVRIQLRASLALVEAGRDVSAAGLALTPLARGLVEPNGPGPALERISGRAQKDGGPALDLASEALERASARLAPLDGYRLLWPLAGERRAAATRLDRATKAVANSRHALRVALELAGSAGPRTFLVLSQNPDELRPTGGYVGTYGLLTSDHGSLRLPRYGAIGTWTDEHPAGVVPPSRAPYVFRYAQPVQSQTLANVNTTPDWPAAAALAADLWRRGGERPVDGVLTFTPALLRRLVGALGAVRVPGYPEVITARNVDARLEFYTHREAVRALDTAVRKQYIADLAQAVLHNALTAPADRMSDVGAAFATGLERRDVDIWLAAPSLQADVRALGWDGGFRARQGDFYADAEFAFVSKNGRGLRRTFTHTVALRGDGSGTADTTMVVRNTRPFEAGYNEDPIYFLTPYGPQGAALAAGSDRPDVDVAELRGHPSAGWLRTIPAGQSTSLHVVWAAPVLAQRRADGLWDLGLTWLPTPGHAGDTLELSVQLPVGWHWRGAPPPRRVALDGSYSKHWLITPGAAA